jgi:hypothetical protein
MVERNFDGLKSDEVKSETLDLFRAQVKRLTADAEGKDAKKAKFVLADGRSIEVHQDKMTAGDGCYFIGDLDFISILEKVPSEGYVVHIVDKYLVHRYWYGSGGQGMNKYREMTGYNSPEHGGAFVATPSELVYHDYPDAVEQVRYEKEIRHCPYQEQVSEEEAQKVIGMLAGIDLEQAKPTPKVTVLPPAGRDEMIRNACREEDERYQKSLEDMRSDGWQSANYIKAKETGREYDDIADEEGDDAEDEHAKLRSQIKDDITWRRK